MPLGSRHRRLAVLGALLCVLLGAAAVVVVRELRGPGEVSNADVEFTEEQEPEAAPARRRPVSRGGPDHPMDDGFAWPLYGYTKARTKYLPLGRPLRPPFVMRWAVRGSILLEFGPVSCRRRLFLLKNNGALYAISRLSGRILWKRKLGYLAAASPACGPDTVYVTVLQRGKGVRAGRVAAIDASNGRTRWSRPLPSRSESSPLLDRNRLVFGTEDGTVFALRASDGAVRWRYRASGPVKGGVALADGKLFFGDYGGRLHAIRRRDGSRVWSKPVGGRVYATPAVAYGRVFFSSVDGFVASVSSATGRTAWRRRTGGYVYSSPAVAPVDGVGPTVFAGSYDKRMYAYDARSGAVRWTRRTGGRISGAPVVLGDLVLYSNLGRRSTAAVGAATGRLVWSTDRGAFNAGIGDEKRIYLVGYSSLFQFTTRRQARRDDRAERRLRGRPERSARQRAADRRAARAERRRKRALQRRVAARQRAVRQNRRRRREGIEVCFRSDGRQVCRIPRKLVCFKRDDRTVCRPRRP